VSICSTFVEQPTVCRRTEFRSSFACDKYQCRQVVGHCSHIRMFDFMAWIQTYIDILQEPFLHVSQARWCIQQPLVAAGSGYEYVCTV
jgi:hypothetical protein